MDSSGSRTFTNRLAVLLLCVLGGAFGCATNPNVRVHRLDNGVLQVEGPGAGPFEKLEDLAANACEFMTSQPGASNGDYGVEYCALYYYSREANGFLLSYLSDIKSQLKPGMKSCAIPRALSDPNHEDAIILGGAHTHPYTPPEFSTTDMSVGAHWNPTRFVDKETGRVWDRSLLMFVRDKAGQCWAYSYNNSTRIVSALREGKWVPIGKAYNDDGDLEMFDGQGWLP
jgi:proteasome lid subunit RPN8/RPN11